METQTQENIREKDFPNRRQPWMAVFLSLISPGLGQIYCGSILAGINVMLVIVIFTTVWMLGTMVAKTPVVPFSIMMWSVISLATALALIDAYRRARRTRYDYVRKDYNNWEIYLALAVISGAGFYGYVGFVKWNMFGAYHITANSMAPTIMLGDRAIANKMLLNYENPQYGDVVLFQNPANRWGNRIKRVVALAGDTVEVKDGQLLINGHILKREQSGTKTFRMGKHVVEGEVFWESNGGARYQIFVSKQEIENITQRKDFGPVTVPQYHCFVMGDNRNHSEDSRQYGPLSYGALKGRFTQIYWPLRHQKSLDASSD